MNPGEYAEEMAHYALTGDPSAREIYDACGWPYHFAPVSDDDKKYLVEHWVSHSETPDRMASNIEVRAFASLYQLPIRLWCPDSPPYTFNPHLSRNGEFFDIVWTGLVFRDGNGANFQGHFTLYVVRATA